MSQNNTLTIPPSLHLPPAADEGRLLELFRFQYAHNALYREYCMALGKNPETVQHYLHIPFLPISFFKTHSVTTGTLAPHALCFESSGTTGEVPSRHYVPDVLLYEEALLQGFRQAYGPPEDYVFLALLPSYLERGHSSLVYMAQVLMRQGGHAANGFYLHEWALLQRQLLRAEAEGQKTLLLGVTFALLDFAAAHPMALRHTTVIETGGMKGRRKEQTRAEVHAELCRQWSQEVVHSEYGMTELLSQAWSHGAGMFTCSPTMRVLVRDIHDPLEATPTGSGCLNIVDTANVHSCCFIATEDLGRVYADGRFEVLGRADHSALRGCSLLTLD